MFTDEDSPQEYQKFSSITMVKSHPVNRGLSVIDRCQIIKGLKDG